MKPLIRIAHYEIIDANMNEDNLETITIPCKTNPVLSYQLDGWDMETSIPAKINGSSVTLRVDHYDKQYDHYLLRIQHCSI